MLFIHSSFVLSFIGFDDFVDKYDYLRYRYRFDVYEWDEDDY